MLAVGCVCPGLLLALERQHSKAVAGNTPMVSPHGAVPDQGLPHLSCTLGRRIQLSETADYTTRAAFGSREGLAIVEILLAVVVAGSSSVVGFSSRR